MDKMRFPQIALFLSPGFKKGGLKTSPQTEKSPDESGLETKCQPFFLLVIHQDSAITEWNDSSFATLKWRPVASENSLLTVTTIS